jgi:hypothetical protein
LEVQAKSITFLPPRRCCRPFPYSLPHLLDPQIVIPQDLVASGIIDKDNGPATAYRSMGHAFDLHPFVKPHGLEVTDNALIVAVP